MIIKEPVEGSQKEKGFFNRFFRLGKRFFYLSIGFAFIFIVLASMEYGRRLAIHNQFISFRHILGNMMETKWEMAANVLKGLFANPDQIYLDIKHKDFQKLVYKREQALQSGKLATVSNEDFVSGQIRHNDKTIPIKIRLKGDAVDHLANEKWSFRIQLKKDYALYGMRTFSIQHPKMRNYLYEWLYHRILAEEKILAPRYFFVKVILNGKNLGIYALEEHFQKNLIERNKNLEGPILKFDESTYWEDYVYSAGTDHVTGLVNEAASTIDAFGMKSIQKDPILYERFLVGRNLLESFRNRKLPAHKVFNIKKMATFLALSDLMIAPHALVWHNLRFYYNPLTSLLEPIGFDGNAGVPDDKGILIGAYYPQIDESWRSFYETLFEDLGFFEEYLKEVERISNVDYLDTFFSKINDELEKNHNILNKEFFYIHFSKELFYRNQQKILKALEPIKRLHAYFQKLSKQSIFLKVGNIQSLPVEVLYLSYKKSEKFYPTKRVLLPSKKNGPDHSVFQEVQFNLPEKFVWSEEVAKDLTIYTKILGTSTIREKEEVVLPWSWLDPQLLNADLLRKTSNVEVFPFLEVNEAEKKIWIRPGTWVLRKNLIIPSSYTVIAKGKTSIDLQDAANIISYSPLSWEGTKDDPVRITSSNATGGGLVVLQASDISVLKYVFFNGFKSPKEPGWQLTGAVTFYQSPVHILNSQFSNLDAEDALNIKNSEFSMDHTVFSKAKSDAVDFDFVNGIMVNSSFEEIKGDAVDISGSEITLQNIAIREVQDKGVSAGERSSVHIDGLNVENANIGIAAKDQSEVHLENVTLSDCQMGIAVFQKKPEFGPASVVAKRISMKQVKEAYLVEENSLCHTDDQWIRPNHKSLASVLY